MHYFQDTVPTSFEFVEVGSASTVAVGSAPSTGRKEIDSVSTTCWTLELTNKKYGQMMRCRYDHLGTSDICAASLLVVMVVKNMLIVKRVDFMVYLVDRFVDVSWIVFKVVILVFIWYVLLVMVVLPIPMTILILSHQISINSIQPNK